MSEARQVTATRVCRCRQRDQEAQEEMSRFELASPAAADLLDIVRYTHQRWGGPQVQRYREELELALQHLSLTPDDGLKRDAVAPGLRFFPVAQHVAFYIQRKDKILVRRILHPRMEVEDAFEQGERCKRPNVLASSGACLFIVTCYGN